MVAIQHGHSRQTHPLVAVLRVAVVGLTLTTAVIHAQLGGLMFLANAAGYAALAAAMVVPGPIARVRWLVRLALLGLTATTIVAWYLFGARFDLAYIDKAIELALIGVLALELWLVDGGPAAIVRRARRLIAVAVAKEP
jgi:hypothetical protein